MGDVDIHNLEIKSRDRIISMNKHFNYHNEELVKTEKEGERHTHYS